MLPPFVPPKPSQATPDEIELYTAGACHHLAVALHRHLGWGLAVVRQENEVYWQDEDDADNFILAVLHVYAIDPEGNAWDVRGARPEAEIQGDCWHHFGELELSTDDCRSEGELQTYVGCDEDEETGETIDRPLDSYTDTDVAQAWALAQRIFAGMPGFQPPPSPARRPRP